MSLRANIVKLGKTDPLKLFAMARTYEDLLELNVAFLQGHIASTPYHASGIDAETVPLVKNLVALHQQAKMMTIEGQPGTLEQGTWGFSEQRPYMCALVPEETMEKIVRYVRKYPKKFVYTFANGAHGEVTTNLITGSFNVTRERGPKSTQWKLFTNFGGLTSDVNLAECAEIVDSFPRVDLRHVWYMKLAMNVPHGTGDLEAELFRALGVASRAHPPSRPAAMRLRHVLRHRLLGVRRA